MSGYYKQPSAPIGSLLLAEQLISLLWKSRPRVVFSICDSCKESCWVVLRNRTSPCGNNARLSFDKKCKHVRFLLTLDFLNLFFKEGGHFRYVCQGFDQVRQELSLFEGARVAHERESKWRVVHARELTWRLVRFCGTSFTDRS